MHHRLLFVPTMIALVTVLALPPQAASAQPHGVACTLAGNASFSPGLTASPTTSTTYTFTGALSNCQSSDATLTSGSVAASGSATGSGLACEGGTSAGSATITWNNGTSTSITF